MKVRLEIIDDDGKIIESSEFSGRHWKKRLLGVLDDVEDENATMTEPSSISSNSEVPIAEQSGHQVPVVQQPVPSIQQDIQQPVQQTAPVQQVQPVQPPQQQVQPVYQQQQFQQAPLQQQQMLQYPQNYVPQPVQQNYQQSQLVQPNLPPVGQQQYGYGQPVQQTPSTVHQPVNPNMQTQPAASYPEQPMQRRTPRLQERMNESLTINERLELFLRYEYPRVWFSSQDVQQHYERVYGTIKQSTVSTYLSRMYRKNLLERRGNRTQREYRYIADEPESTYRMEEASEAPVYHRLQY
ncbi:hypothetical protein [Methanolobus sp. WCC4]|uniref:hypothetical protein n=1 Tax=Methanolobus sp. WCC4 TaxID=3125784 RepID=UPI0030F97076